MLDTADKPDSEKTIDDFMFPDYCLPVRNMDIKGILALNDSDFARIYLGLMSEYRDKDGWWKDGKIPNCWECKEPIPGPEQLRRYKGASVHGVCFEKYYSKERSSNNGKLDRAYWARVAKLDFTKPVLK